MIPKSARAALGALSILLMSSILVAPSVVDAHEKGERNGHHSSHHDRDRHAARHHHARRGNHTGGPELGVCLEGSGTVKVCAADALQGVGVQCRSSDVPHRRRGWPGASFHGYPNLNELEAPYVGENGFTLDSSNIGTFPCPDGDVAAVFVKAGASSGAIWTPPACPVDCSMAEGASNEESETEEPPPEEESTELALVVDNDNVAPGESVTVSLQNAPGGDTDWISLAPVGTPGTSFLQWKYVGAGVTELDWTVNMPATEGTYEFRLHPNNTYEITIASAPITVTAP